MRGLGASFSILCLALLASAGVAQPPEESAPGPAPPQAAEPPEDEDRESGEAAEDIFIPSDEIQADEEVTFPVDI